MKSSGIQNMVDKIIEVCGAKDIPAVRRSIEIFVMESFGASSENIACRCDFDLIAPAIRTALDDYHFKHHPVGDFL